MTPADRYIDDVMRNLFASPVEKERFEADLRAHFAEAEARGESPSQIIAEMGRAEDVAAAFNGEREIEYAGFWHRFLAFVADASVLMLLVLPGISLVLLAETLWPAEGPSIARILLFTTMAITIFGAGVLYFPLLEARFGKTLGKALMKLRVLREDGRPITLGQAFIRRLAFYFEMLVPDALFIPFTDKRQRALDIVAKTIVAREPGDRPSAWAVALCVALPLAVALAIVAMIVIAAPA